MAVALALMNWVPVILQSLPRIIQVGHELYSLWCSMRGTHTENDAVLKAMKLLNKYQDDIDRLLQNPQQKRELLEGLSILMNRINQSNTNQGGPYGWNMPGGGDCGGSFPSKPSSYKGGRWRECDVCRCEYNTTNKRPIILYCGHTFCRECLGRLPRQGFIKCPTCRVNEIRPIASIPTNTGLMQVLEEWDGKSGDNCRGDDDDDSCCKGGNNNNSSSSGGCDGISLSYEEQIKYAIFLSQQEAQIQGPAFVERSWREVEEAEDERLASALQESEIFEASRKCAQQCQADGGCGPSHSGEDDTQEEQQDDCGAPSCPDTVEDENSSLLLALKLQEEEITKMKRLCGNSSDNWSKEMHTFFGPSLAAQSRGRPSLLQRDGNNENRCYQETEFDEDEATCCSRKEDEDGNDEDTATCYTRTDDEGRREEDENVLKCHQDQEQDSDLNCTAREEDPDDCNKDLKDDCCKDSSSSNYSAWLQGEEDLMVEMAISLSLDQSQPPPEPEKK